MKFLIVFLTFIVASIIFFLWQFQRSQLKETLHVSPNFSIKEENPKFQLSYVKIKQRKPRCSSILPRKLLEYGRKSVFESGIPRILHYIYKSENIPEQYVELVKGCVTVNSDMKFILWTDYTAYRLILKYFPESIKMYRAYFQKGVERLKRFDLIRYFILYKFGGIYMDMDTRCQKPFHTVMKDHGCFLSKAMDFQTQILHNKQYTAMNSLMGCVPQHDFFRGLSLGKDFGNPEKNILTLTGPFMLTDVLEKYSASLSVANKNRKTGKTTKIHLWKSETFSPFVDISVGTCYGILYGMKKTACEQFMAYEKVKKDVIESAVTVHLFYHLGYSFSDTSIRNTRDICIIGNFTTPKN